MLVGSSENLQSCRSTDKPLESIAVTAPFTGSYVIGIRKMPTARPRTVEVTVRDLSLQYGTRSYSLAVPADSPAAFTVGAVDWQAPNVIASYSSEGPTWDGRVKPDIVAPASTSTRSYGVNTFRGTSASAPHVAGAAALVKQAFPHGDLTRYSLFSNRGLSTWARQERTRRSGQGASTSGCLRRQRQPRRRQ